MCFNVSVPNVLLICCPNETLKSDFGVWTKVKIPQCKSDDSIQKDSDSAQLVLCLTCLLITVFI